MDFLILENAKVWDFKEHPFDFSGKVHIDFSTFSENSRICGKIKGGAFEILDFRIFSCRCEGVPRAAVKECLVPL